MRALDGLAATVPEHDKTLDGQYPLPEAARNLLNDPDLSDKTKFGTAFNMQTTWKVYSDNAKVNWCNVSVRAIAMGSVFNGFQTIPTDISHYPYTVTCTVIDPAR